LRLKERNSYSRKVLGESLLAVSVISDTERLGGLLRRIGNFDADSFITNFQSRLIVQKTIYLMQAFGLNLGYFYNWYIHGPYSPSLAKDAFALAKTKKTSRLVRFVDPSMEIRFLDFQRFIENHKSDPVWLEKIASTHFLKTAYHISDPAQVFRIVKEKVPSLTSTEFKFLWADLKAKNLVS